MNPKLINFLIFLVTAILSFFVYSRLDYYLDAEDHVGNDIVMVTEAILLHEGRYDELKTIKHIQITEHVDLSPGGGAPTKMITMLKELVEKYNSLSKNHTFPGK